MEKLQSCRVFHISKRLRIDELNNEHYKLGILSYTDIHCVEQMFLKAILQPINRLEKPCRMTYEILALYVYISSN